ncbi:hypothetical protein BJ875DRAFT_203394 [Amylocarpus encephaloides]|uniref:Uncharacterized protein n=1 Tax=Amylocarpus encephaloides TaxID=45428 RepID=A0A9P7Y9J7_9HELO|nr:hypothetical protein BJ875DRAFT_203394 [Amylocarpus encephaloides]
MLLIPTGRFAFWVAGRSLARPHNVYSVRPAHTVLRTAVALRPSRAAFLRAARAAQSDLTMSYPYSARASQLWSGSCLDERPCLQLLYGVVQSLAGSMGSIPPTPTRPDALARLARTPRFGPPGGPAWQGSERSMSVMDLWICLFVSYIVCFFHCLFLSLFVSFIVCFFHCLFLSLFVCFIVCFFHCLFVSLSVSFIVCLFLSLFVSFIICFFHCLFLSLFVSS